jgi:hypothetical protein
VALDVNLGKTTGPDYKIARSITLFEAAANKKRVAVTNQDKTRRTNRRTKLIEVSELRTRHRLH